MAVKQKKRTKPKLDRLVRVLVTPEMFEAIAERARTDARSVSAYARKVLCEHLGIEPS